MRVTWSPLPHDAQTNEGGIAKLLLVHGCDGAGDAGGPTSIDDDPGETDRPSRPQELKQPARTGPSRRPRLVGSSIKTDERVVVRHVVNHPLRGVGRP